MDSQKYWYLHVGRASDLQGFDRRLYRFLEMIPGLLSLGTIAAFVALSFYRPVWAAYLTIMFAAYWLFKTAYLSVHLRHNFKRMLHNMQVNWNERLKGKHFEHFTHLVILPYYNEPYEVLLESVRSIAQSNWNTKKIAIVIAAEERAGQAQHEVGRRIKEEFKDSFFEVLVTIHPSDMPGEMPGKGSNIAYAAEEARIHILEAHSLKYNDVIVSAFDSDTVVYADYFACLTWHVVTAEHPTRSSFQPVPLYNNNIWEAPMLSRVLAYSSSFWQMIQQERPEKLATFSSHAMLFGPLHEANYWQRNMVSEDSRIFWNLFVRYDGDYRVVPMAYPVSMDANVADTYWGTIVNIYKQHRRWTYGAENVAYIIFACIKNPRIPFTKKARSIFFQIEGFWSLATHPLILFAIGWLPLVVGGSAFHTTVLSYSLPVVARSFLTLAMFGLIVSASICMYLIPERPNHVSRRRTIAMIFQWILVPMTMVIFSSIPGLESQMRLLFGRYLGFWVTPKARTPGASSSEEPGSRALPAPVV